MGIRRTPSRLATTSAHKKGAPCRAPRLPSEKARTLQRVGPLAMGSGIEPFAFLLFADAQPHGHVDQLERHEAHHARPGDGDQHAFYLRHHLAGHRIAVDTDPAQRRRDEDAGADGADDAADAVDAEYVETVVVADHLLQAGDAPQAHHAGERAEDDARSEEHTSELQSPKDLVCRLLLE